MEISLLSFVSTCILLYKEFEEDSLIVYIIPYKQTKASLRGIKWSGCFAFLAIHLHSVSPPCIASFVCSSIYMVRIKLSSRKSVFLKRKSFSKESFHLFSLSFKQKIGIELHPFNPYSYVVSKFLWFF